MTRADCIDGPRPCPRTQCKWHEPNGCALDVADQGGASSYQVGAVMGVSHKRVQQLEARALMKLSKRKDAARLLREMLE